jgi:ATP-binding cassette, subfamily B, bacterial MsbA
MIAFLRRIYGLARPYQSRFILGLLCGVSYAFVNATLPLVLQLVIDLVFAPAGTVSLDTYLKKAPDFIRHSLEGIMPHLTSSAPSAVFAEDWEAQSVYLVSPLNSPKTHTGLVLVIIAVPLVMLLRGLFVYLNVYLMNWVAARAVTDLRIKLFDHVQNLSLSFFNQASTGELLSRVANDTWALHQTISSSFAVITKEPVTVIALVAWLISQQPRLTLVSMMVFPICVVPVVVYGRKMRKSSQALQTHTAELATVMHEAFTGNRIIKAYNLEGKVLEQFKATTHKHIGQFMRVVRAQEIPGPLIELVAALGIALVILYAKVWSGVPVTSGAFFGFVFAIFLLYQPIKSLSRLQSQLEQARAASVRVFELLDMRPAITDPPSPKPLHAEGADIQFDAIDFSYGEKPVLRGINLIVKAGQVVALVGSSGSGKTTLTNLLLRFYDPQHGTVLIGDTAINQVTARELRSKIAVVTQETILFNDTIRNNIALGRPGTGAIEIEEAARHAFAHDFIVEKPRGYDTIIGEKGVALSGGQRQRLAIARAILKNAPILILDEATSALDTESERAVQAALEELMKGRTTLCIAHRLSTIRRADRILVFEQGRIVETGTHEELLDARGLYWKLHQI